MSKFKLVLLLMGILFILGCSPEKRKDGGFFYNVVCLGGHLYYSGSHSLAIVLDDDGKPVSCDKKESIERNQ